MWPWGHVAVAYLCYSIAVRIRANELPDHGPVLMVVVGSLFPDIVDKPLAWYLGVLPTGRTLAHSLLVLIPLSYLGYRVANRFERPEYGIAFAIGALSHSIVDALPVLWDAEAEANFLLWPLLAVEPYEEGAPSVLRLLLDSLSSPYFLSEFVLLGIAAVLWRRDGYPGAEPVRAFLR
ncbi:Membrane-bound metal-dependent hydrolase YbcI, DUF457 family [Halalkaliarchaeum sp. AArc-CO]|uniref:metal-dependent hydrolase n=1 Tax=unclassified Halalkaliarchaeum TaxID=2678344 RepID=UPI00217D6579|nr:MULTISPECIES: metal-dependent hydrolase [unclassified Halalkaliarchaeum]MDR5674376.1 metal-dependent hydrolase [Halalkaliarchaeum sp. AArc-GB]UWG52191.1 Membrane-bound metal-dependent hydrolase YbcI, DUF457 family [Halalkaliarchaeum sp. AArc-CO]